MTADVLLGTQGWSHPAWVGPFYPSGTRQGAMLGLYARAFCTVEVDSTFYGIPASPVLREWCAAVPPGFVFSVKVPQEITHARQLRGAEPVLGQFLERVSILEDRLGALLIQLSPAFRATEENRAVWQEFLRVLPRSYRWAVEFRDRNWLTGEVLDGLGERGVALALADGRWIPRRTMLDLCRRPTADFGYVRWMGGSSRIGGAPEGDLVRWSDAVRRLRSRVAVVYGYFNDRFQGHGPGSVRAFQRLLGQAPVEPAALQEQAELFR